jgi:hypothetical protein
MGCCRGPRRRVDSRHQSADCKRLEEVGARTVVRVVATDRGLQLVVPTSRNGFVHLSSFIGSFKCDGPTARLLKRYLPVIMQASESKPEAFASYRSGIKITDLIRVAEKVTKGKNDARKNPSQAVP